MARKFKLYLDSLDDVAEGDRELYTEQADGKFAFTGAEYGAKEIKALKDEAGSWRIKYKDTTKALDEVKGSWGDLSADDVKEKLTRLAELEAASDGKPITEVRRELATLRTENQQLKSNITEDKERINTLSKDLERYKGNETKRTMLDAVRAEAAKMGEGGPDPKTYASELGALNMLVANICTVNELGQVVVKEGVAGYEAHMPVAKLLESLKEEHAYLWPNTRGSGANGTQPGGNVGKNPFKTNDFAARAKLLKENPAEGQKLMKEVGLTDPMQKVDDKGSPVSNPDLFMPE